MARQIRIEYPGAIYHITSQGNAQQPIFETKADRYHFLSILEQGCKRYQWSVYACYRRSKPAGICRYFVEKKIVQPLFSIDASFRKSLF